MPDDAAFALADVFLGGFDAEVLVDAGQFFDAAIEENEIVHELDKAVFGADFEEVFVEFEAGIVLFVFFPAEEEFFFRADCAVFEAFGIVAREDELDGAEEWRVELRLLRL